MPWVYVQLASAWDIDDIGDISLPLKGEDARAVMKAGGQTPFGRGSEIVVDTSFRNTKRLDVDCFELRNLAWTVHLETIIKRLGPGLGLPDAPPGIKAELYKMLSLYAEGCTLLFASMDFTIFICRRIGLGG